MAAYQDQETGENDLFGPPANKFSQAYYTKKVN